MLKRLYLIGLCSISTAFASAVGDSYQKVIADNGQPKSQLGAGSVQILVYPAFSVKLRDGMVVSVTATPVTPSSSSSDPASHPSSSGGQDPTDAELAAMPEAQRLKALSAMRKRAVDRVNIIVNQSVDSIPLTRELRAGAWGPPWFHPGAMMPDFDHADIRKTQETNYAKFEYICCAVCPGLAFKGADCEFNAQTKYFYQDRTRPKKLLTETEMLEINRLYRIIGKCNVVLGQLPANTSS